MDAPATFSVIFPTYNRCDVVERTLRQLVAQAYPSDGYEIIVVDNSTDDTPAMVERVAAESAASAGPEIRLLWIAERLPAVKRNRGLALATGDLAFFINDDIWFAPDALAEHAATHAAWNEPIAVLGSCRQSPEMDQTPFVEFYEPFAYHEMRTYEDRPVPYRYFWSMNLSLPRQVMLERNLVFHEDWAHIGHEDVELGWRWTQAGLKAVYNPRARGDHFHPHTVASACRLQESVGRGLRDLEVLVPDPNLLERYGIFSVHNSPKSVVRGGVREVLFNRWTAPAMARWLDGRERNTAFTRWAYWKVLLHHTNRGFRTEPRRTPAPLSTTAAAGSVLEAAG
jgi:glycosyltransferase involved in cell wall biosynthesis